MLYIIKMITQYFFIITCVLIVILPMFHTFIEHVVAIFSVSRGSA